MILWKNGFIHSMENENQVYDHMYTHQGMFISFDHIYEDVDEIINLHGAHVYPGFVDAHLHILGYGEMLSQISLAQLETKDEILFKIKETLKDNYIYYGMREQLVTKHDLNKITMTMPIIIKHSDYHRYTVNDVVLSTCHIDSEDGYLNETQIDIVSNHYFKYTKNQLVTMITKAFKNLYSFGVTGGHSDDLHYFNGYDETLDAFKIALRKNKFRTQLLIHFLELDGFIHNKHKFMDQGFFLQLGPVKMFYDGTLSSKSAYLSSPYKDSESNGLKMQSDDDFIINLKKVRKYRLPVAVHVIGDQGLEDLLEILKSYPPHGGLHDRIIHASLMTKKSLELMKDMPLIVDVQPQFIKSDFPEAFNLFSCEPDYIYAFKSMLEHNITICGSSDAPVEIPNPLLGMHAAIKRKQKDGSTLNRAERISRFEALKLYTTYANIPTYHYNRGLIKKGYIADFVVFEHDLLEIPSNDLLTTKPLMTVIDEKVVFKG